MFRDVPALFMTDGVHADLVRAGEPRLRRASRDRDAAAVTAPAPARRPLLRRLVRPLAA